MIQWKEAATERRNAARKKGTKAESASDESGYATAQEVETRTPEWMLMWQENVKPLGVRRDECGVMKK